MIFTIAGKDLKSLFTSPVAWVVLTFVQIIVGYGFLKRFDDFLSIQPQLLQLPSPPGFTELVAVPTFSTTAAIMLFAVPLLAMRLIAEERRNQTMVLLTSAPISILDIVLGKFLALMGMMMVILALITLMPLSLSAATHLDYRLIASILLGLSLIAATFSAVSLYISSLTMHPIVAALGAFGALLGMVLVGEQVADNLQTRGPGVIAAFAQVFSPVKNFEPLGRGMIDTYAIACLLLLAALFLALTVRQLEARRLRG
ncbi:MAG TPA: ABC transporter permease [Burkholderiales bacterium]|nr:ABC transporter permease [Burkholderiales bacterium]